MEDNLDLKDKMAKGLKWLMISRLTHYLLHFIFVAILARLLFPQDFGLIAIVTIFIHWGLVFRDFGFEAVIIQRKEIREAHRTTTFIVSILSGTLLFGIVIFLAPLISKFFNKEILRLLIIVISFKFIFFSLGAVHKSMLNRDLQFRKLALVIVVEALIYGSVAISIALNGGGIWSFIYGQLAAGLVRVILLWKLYPWRPRLIFDWEAFKEIFGFAKNWVGFRIFMHLRESLDSFLIGRFLGIAPLGFYSLAYTIANFPQERLSSIVAQVGFPAFSKIQDNLGRLREGYLRIVSYISIITFPLLMGAFAVSRQFVIVVFSSKWIPMVSALKILCIAGLFLSISGISGIVTLSMGRTNALFKYSVIAFIGRIIALLIGARYGLEGICIAIVFYSLAMNLILNSILKNLVNLKFTSYFKALLPAIFSSIIMVLVLSIFLRLQRDYFFLSDGALLISSILLGGVAYLISLFFIRKSLIKEILEVFRRMI